MRNYFILSTERGSGVILDSRDYGIYISGAGTFAEPARKGQFASVPGRNGDVYLDGGAYENVIVTYPAFMAPADGEYGQVYGRWGDMRVAWSYFIERLKTIKEYVYIGDSYMTFPDNPFSVWRKGLLIDEINPQISAAIKTATFDLSFNCEPFKTSNVFGTNRLHPGETVTLTLSRDAVMQYLSIEVIKYTSNVEIFEVVDSNGVNNVRIAFPSNVSKVTIDSEAMECIGTTSSGEISANSFVSFSRHEFPVNNGEITINNTGTGDLKVTYREVFL